MVGVAGGDPLPPAGRVPPIVVSQRYQEREYIVQQNFSLGSALPKQKGLPRLGQEAGLREPAFSAVHGTGWGLKSLKWEMESDSPTVLPPSQQAWSMEQAFLHL